MCMMSPATAHDRPGIRSLMVRRGLWLTERGVSARSIPDPKAAADLAGQAEDNGRPMVWTCRNESGDLCGTTMLLSQMPAATWTDEEPGQRALLLHGVWTDPDLRSDRLAQLITWWALDHASRQEVGRLRTTTSSEHFSRYLQHQGWTYERTVRGNPTRTDLLSRPTRPAPPGLRRLIGDGLCNPRPEGGAGPASPTARAGPRCARAPGPSSAARGPRGPRGLSPRRGPQTAATRPEPAALRAPTQEPGSAPTATSPRSPIRRSTPQNDPRGIWSGATASW
jgi:hypothetical protein